MAPNAEANRPPASGHQELLQDGASVQHEGEVLFGHDEGEETELPEAWECDGGREGGGRRKPSEADVEFCEGGASKERGREMHGRVEICCAAEKNEFLDALGG